MNFFLQLFLLLVIVLFPLKKSLFSLYLLCFSGVENFKLFPSSVQCNPTENDVKWLNDRWIEEFTSL